MSRGRFQGLLNVVRFNWDMYLKAGLVLCAVFLIPWPGQMGFWARLGAAGACYFLLVSLLVSHYVYDLSDLYRWNWLKSKIPAPERLVNIHSGFDETTEQLMSLYPGCRVAALDFFDPNMMSEPSIHRARRAYPDRYSQSVSYDDLPLEDSAEELVTCLLAAHELREHALRVEFFSEVHRSLQVDGRLIVLEHLRDLPNFLAFGPGFVHFFSRENWLAAFAQAGFWVEEEFRVTPFLRGFVCRKLS